MHKEIIFVHYYICSFSVFVENCILLSKGINEYVVFVNMVLIFTLLPRLL